MNFLELVNAAIQESGTDLDDLTSANFASPPRTIMYERMKRWVNRSYKEILQKREEWYTLQERTVQTVYPRIRINALTVVIALNDEYQGLDSGVRFLVKRITTDVADPDGDTVLDITYVDEGDTHLLPGESISRIAPSIVADAMRMEGYAGYDFALDVPTIQEVDLDSIYVQAVPNSVLDDRFPGSPQPVYQVIWDKWGLPSFPDVNAHGTPQLVTRGPDGLIEFWPRLDKAYSFIYSYTRVVPDLSLYSDLPREIPTELQMAIVWRAVMKYARFDTKDKLYMNARDEYRFYNNKLEETKLPEPVMGRNLFWA